MGYAEAEYIIDELRQKIPTSVGSGIPPKQLDFSVNSLDYKFFLYWTPENTFLGGKTICVQNGVRFVVKAESEPVDMNDGIAYEVEDAEFYAHSGEPYIIDGHDIFEVKTEYHIKAYAKSDQGVFELIGLDKTCTFSSKEPTQVMGFHQDFTDLNPSTSITYLEDCDNAGFIPMRTNLDIYVKTFGDWQSWSWFRKLQPAMLHYDGTVDYLLDPYDYTKKIDGSESEIDKDYDGWGGFVWIPRIFVKEVYASDGNSRDVYFTMDEVYADTNGFHDFVFKRLSSDYANAGWNENYAKIPTIPVNGYWISMFYPTTSGTYWTNGMDGLVVGKSLCTPGYRFCCYENRYDGGMSPQEAWNVWRVFDTKNGHAANTNWHVDGDYFVGNTGCFGGPISYLFRDILYMLYKTTNLSDVSGAGKAYTNYSSDPGPKVDSSNAILPLTGGANIGHTSANSGATKIFHSIALGGLLPIQGLCGRMSYAIRSYSGKHCVHPTRIMYPKSVFSTTLASDLTNVIDNSSIPYAVEYLYNMAYFSKLKFVDQIGSVIDIESSNDATSTSGLCASICTQAENANEKSKAQMLDSFNSSFGGVTTTFSSATYSALSTNLTSNFGNMASRGYPLNTLASSCLVIAPSEDYEGPTE